MPLEKDVKLKKIYIKRQVWIALITLVLILSSQLGLEAIAPPRPAANAIQIENVLAGTSDWQLHDPAIQHEIEGYASLTSVDRGGEIRLFVNTRDPEYSLEVFRMGWYGGLGARRMIDAVQLSGRQQPPPQIDRASGLIECDWQDPYVLTVGRDWTSGVFLARLTGSSGKQSYIIFVVRDDDRPSDYLFQSSVNTFQAYNNWGGRSLYAWNSPDKQAYQVSFNRPYAASPNSIAASGVGAGEFLTNMQPLNETPSAGWEYNMVRWLEHEGYDVTYGTDVDTHANGRSILRHRVFLAVGHDEYWSWSMRQAVEAARDRGVSLGFFSANVCYWQVRLLPSAITGAVDRTIVAYKERWASDPYERDRDRANDQQVTTRWHLPPVNRSEAALVGVRYFSDEAHGDIVIADTAPDWSLAETNLHPGDRLTGLLGYEVDAATSESPANLTLIGSSPIAQGRKRGTSHMSVYTADSGAAVVATGTMQWPWGLDDFNAPQLRPPVSSVAVQQMTRNLLNYLLEQSRP